MDDSPNPYAPPATNRPAEEPATTDPEELDALIARTRVSLTVRAAIGLVSFLGGLLLANALQLWGVVYLSGLLRIVPFVMLVLGVVLLVLGAKIYRQRPWAAVTALVLSSLTATVTALWFLLSTASGFLSLLALLVPLEAVVAAVFAGLAIGPCRRTAEARRKLAASGLQVDF